MVALLESAKENIIFLGVCLAVFIVVYVLARLFQRFLANDLTRIPVARHIAYVAVFSAIGGLLMFFEIPLFFAPSFYQIDFGELPVMICTFYLGPSAGVTAELIKVLIKLVLKGTSTAFVGEFASFILGCSYILPASIIYHIRRSKKSAVFGLVVATIFTTAFGSLFNAYYLIPTYVNLFGIPLDGIIAMGTEVNARITSLPTLVLYAVVPFNILKYSLVSLLTFFLYKRVNRLFFNGHTKNKKHTAAAKTTAGG